MTANLNLAVKSFFGINPQVWNSIIGAVLVLFLSGGVPQQGAVASLQGERSGVFTASPERNYLMRRVLIVESLLCLCESQASVSAKFIIHRNWIRVIKYHNVAG